MAGQPKVVEIFLERRLLPTFLLKIRSFTESSSVASAAIGQVDAAVGNCSTALIYFFQL